MRQLAKNKTKMSYSLYLTKADVYDYYEDNEGNKFPIKTGEKEEVYSTPKPLKANISMSGSDAEAEAYGLSIADYEAVLVYSKNEYPLVEGSLIWLNSPIEYKYDGEEIEVDMPSGKKVKTKAPVRVSADYTVIKIADSLNETRAVLKAVNK